MQFKHQSVLLKEVIENLKPNSNQDFIDGTVGGGGHAKEILKLSSPNGRLLGLDLDPQAIKAAAENMAEFKNRFILINDNYSNLKKVAYEQGFNHADGILLDLGLSSFELEDTSRGFSFKGFAPLDMRMGQTQKTAADILNGYKKEELAKIFKEYGEERYANQIADEIVKFRRSAEFKTTDQLTNLIVDFYKHKPRPKKIHEATKVYQALRIEVNQELAGLKRFLPQALELLNPGGRLAIISFHSLEDRIVKEFFKQESRDCICPPEVLQCTCKHQPKLKIITKKPIIPTDREVADNPRSRSAKLRIAEKL